MPWWTGLRAESVASPPHGVIAEARTKLRMPRGQAAKSRAMEKPPTNHPLRGRHGDTVKFCLP